jgi:hypothetical protein
MPDFFFLSDSAGTVTTPAQVGSSSNTSLVTAVLDYVRSHMELTGGTTRPSVSFNIASGSYSSGWLRFSFGGNNTILVNNDPILILRGATSDLFRFVAKTSPANSWAAEYWNGSAWVQIGAIQSSPSFTADKVCNVRWVIADSGGEFRVYINGSEVITLTGDTRFTADTTINTVEFRPPYNTGGNAMRVYYGVIVDDADTRGLYIDESQTLANGAETGFLNAEVDIDEFLGSFVATDFIIANAANQRETYTFNSINAGLAGGTVEAVMVGITARSVTDPGLLLKGTARVGGTNYDTASGTRPTAVDWGDYRFVFENNPATSSPWTQAEVNAAEFGLKSEA